MLKSTQKQRRRTVEYNDIYDKDRNLTGRMHLRGTTWQPGEFGLVVCVWVYDGRGRILLTRRAPGKIFAGTWENSGGAAQAGEDSLTAIRRELWEETGIREEKEKFEFLNTSRDEHKFYDHYCLKWNGTVEDVVLLPGETDAVKWVTFDKIHRMIAAGEICRIIAQQFLEEEPKLLARQSAQEK
jgi:8-oxo-dGTP pyrophosphatase MutT (NUDIX family)